MPKTSHILALVFSLLVSVGCVNQEQYRRALQDNDNLREQLEILGRRNEALQARIDELIAQIEAMPDRPTEDWQNRLQELMAEMERLRGTGLPTGVTVRRGEEGIVFDIEGSVLFASGKTEITSGGRDTLQSLVASLKANPRRIRVEGHTDTDPIVNSPWKTNLRLSAERALVVAEFLTSSGIDASRVGIAGYGPHRPVDPANTDAAKAKNRRVEIVLLNEPQVGEESR